MSKNIEININTNGNSYEALYPKTLAGNVQAGTFSGSFTFSSPPSCSTNPSSTSHLVNKSYADSVVNGYATQSWVNSMLQNVGGGDAYIARTSWRGNGSSNTVRVIFPYKAGYKLYSILITFDGFMSTIGRDRTFTPLVNLNSDTWIWQYGQANGDMFSSNQGTYYSDNIVTLEKGYNGSTTYYALGLFAK